MNKRLPILLSFVLFLALCASTTYWVLLFMKPPQRPLASVAQPVDQVISLEAAEALFGGRAAKVAMANNFQLKGVVAAGDGYEGVAIIGIDGKPPVASRVNSELQPGVRVKEVHPRYVLLTDGGVVKRVDLQDTKSATQMSTTSLATMMAQREVPPPQRIEMPPPQPQTAPALQSTFVLPGQPPNQVEPPPPSSGQPNSGVSIPPANNGAKF